MNIMKKLITLFLLSTAFISNAQRAMFGGQNNYIAPAGPTTQTPSVTSAGGRIWMDRNLGASRVATSLTDVASFGDLYQWGRGTDGHEKRTSVTTSTLSSSDVPGNAKFITISNRDWLSAKNDNLWQGVNGINNPCPAGFRLPTEAEWSSERSSWSSPDQDGAFASPLKLPRTGYRKENGSIYDTNAGGHYWSSTVRYNVAPNYIGRARPMVFAAGYFAIADNARSYGFSCRCIKD
jgi:uncharacterized protein (TIGR02145 family)